MSRTPITVLTGFLGSGKTTLLNRALSQPRFARSAVIVNEFGAVGLDHELIAASRDQVVLLDNGCLCCEVRSDLIGTLNDLQLRRGAGLAPAFDRVVIETSGLADPSAIIAAVTGDRIVAAHFALGGVVTTLDAVNGLPTLERHDEARRQLALADRVVVTKADVEAPSAALNDAIAAANALAEPITAQAADAAETLSFELAPVLGKRVAAATPAHRLRLSIRTLTLVRDEPIEPEVLDFFLTALEQTAGPALLRVKALVCLSTQPDRPLVVHGVQRLIHRTATLDRWPGADRRTRIVVIAMSDAIDDLADLLARVERMSQRTRAAREPAAACR